MPRLPASLFRRARQHSPTLPLLLPTLRTLPAARLEHRWLRAHVQPLGPRAPLARAQSRRLRRLCAARGRGAPLQHVLGTAFFGALELRCARGVLVPRWESAASVSRLAAALRAALPPPSPLRVLDLCCGSGCMGLLLRHEVPGVRLRGVDAAARARALARANAARVRGEGLVEVVAGDVLRGDGDWAQGAWDVVLANPPYVGPRTWLSGATERSVRWFEPRAALVPPLLAGVDGEEGRADVFYGPILKVAERVGARVVLMEVADLEQARRVVALVLNSDDDDDRGRVWEDVEIWRDEPDAWAAEEERVGVDGASVRVRGEGNGRTVVCWRGEGAEWMRQR